MKFGRLNKAAIVAMGAGLLLSTPGVAQNAARKAAVDGKQVYSGEYTVTFLGLPVARSNFVSTFNGNRFNVQGQVSSSGVGKLFDSTTGTSNVSGSFVGGQVQPANFRVQYKSGKKTQTTAIQFAGGRVSKTVNTPALRKRDNWIPLKAGDLRAVTDPISATLIRADSDDEVCKRTLKVYDGQMRVDLRLSYASKGPVSGVDGEAITCNARFVPVSGYRKNNRSVAYLKDRAKISISFARLGETGVYAPVRAYVSTTLGPVTVKVKRTKV